MLRQGRKNVRTPGKLFQEMKGKVREFLEGIIGQTHIWLSEQAMDSAVGMTLSSST